MSWDIFVQDIPTTATRVADIPDDFEPRSLGSRAEIIGRILTVVPADFHDPSWGTFSGDGFSVEFDMGEDEELDGFALHVRGGDIVVGLVADLLARCGWRAFDPSSDSGMFEPASAVEGLKRWRAYRDRVFGSR